MDALAKFREFIQKHGDCQNGYETSDLASEYANLKKAWWGNNLVFLGIEEKENRYYPTFNVFD
jgi:hypothetical protein